MANNVKRFEEQVWEVAIESVGSVENSISDGNWLDDDGLYRSPTRESLREYVEIDVMDECSKETRFLGKAKINAIIEKALDEFEYPFGVDICEAK